MVRNIFGCWYGSVVVQWRGRRKRAYHARCQTFVQIPNSPMFPRYSKIVPNRMVAVSHQRILIKTMSYCQLCWRNSVPQPNSVPLPFRTEPLTEFRIATELRTATVPYRTDNRLPYHRRTYCVHLKVFNVILKHAYPPTLWRSACWPVSPHF